MQEATLEGPRVKEMIPIIWDVSVLGDEMKPPVPKLAKLAERSSDLLDRFRDSVSRTPRTKM